MAAATKTPVPTRTPKPTLTPTPAPVVGMLALVGSSSLSGPTGTGNKVYVVGTDGKNGKVIKDYGTLSNSQFNTIFWSPDGSSMAFYSGQPPALNIASADGSDIKQVPNAYNIFCWSPDGTQITTASLASDTMTLNIANVDPATGNRTQLFSFKSDLGYIDFIRWSPDGKRLLFLGTPASGAVDSEEIHLVNADGSNDQIVVPANTLSRTAMWSPDGQKIAYIGASGKAGMGLFVLDLATNKAKKVIPTAVAADWSPDGSEFAYVTSGGQLFTANADGTKPHPVAKPAGVTGGIAAVAWRPPLTLKSAETPPATMEATAGS